MVRVVADPTGDWRQLDERIEPVTDEIKTLAKSDDSCRRVMRPKQASTGDRTILGRTTKRGTLTYARSSCKLPWSSVVAGELAEEQLRDLGRQRWRFFRD